MKFEHNNISPLDNRYSSKILDTRLCFSEAELIKQRFIIEIDWLIYLCDKHPKHFLKISNTLKNKLSIFKNQFSINFSNLHGYKAICSIYHGETSI